MKNKIRVWLFMRKVKTSSGICTSWLRNKPHCAKWVNVYAGFLNEKERHLFEALVRIGKLKKISGTFSLNDSTGNIALSNPIYS